MKRYDYLLLAALLALAATACGGDDGGGGGGYTPTPDQPKEMNANRNLVTTGTPQEVARLEFPHLRGGSDNLVLVHRTAEGVNLAVEWDCAKKSQRWTCYQMTNTSAKGGVGRYGTFEEDPDLPVACRHADTNALFRGSGFDRGHICPSGDRQYSREANHQTFYYSNIQPQYNNFNAGANYDGAWVLMENYVRKTANALRNSDTLYVCKGGTIDSEENILTRVKGQLIVPKYFYMALLVKNAQGYKAMAFWAEHVNRTDADGQLAKYVISIDELEKKTGIDFFCNLPDDIEERTEASVNTTSWAL